jgi:hypothetical protein
MDDQTAVIKEGLVLLNGFADVVGRGLFYGEV